MSPQAEIVADGVLPHYGFRDASRKLAEWYDTLAPGDTLKLTVPDFEWHVRRWLVAPESRRWSSLLHALFGFQNGPGQQQLTGFTAPRIAELLAEAGFEIELLTWIWHRDGKAIRAEATRGPKSLRREVVPLEGFASQFADARDIALASREAVREFLSGKSIAIEGMHLQAVARSEYGLLIDCVLRSPSKRMIAFALPLYGSAESPRLELPDEWSDASENLRSRILDRAQQTLAQVFSGGVGRGTGSITVGYDPATPWPPPGDAIVAGAAPYSQWIPLLKRHLLAESLAAGGRVLAIGSAVAFGAHVLARSARRVDALEWSADNLGHIRRFVTPANVHWIGGDPASLPVRGESYDVIAAAAGVADVESLARQAAGLLRPGGYLIVSTTRAESDQLQAAVAPHCADWDRELLGQPHWSADVEPEGQSVLSRQVMPNDEYVVAVCRRPVSQPAHRDAPADETPDGALPPIVWSAPFLSGGGFGEEARMFAAGLAAMGCSIRAVPVGSGDRAFLEGLDPVERLRLQTLVTAEIGTRPPIFVCHGDTMPAPDALATIGRFAFHTDGLPRGLAERWDRVDEIWVASEFNRRSFMRAGIDANKIRVVAQPVDVHAFAPDVAPLPVPGRRAFAFLSMLPWHARTGWDVLLRAYVQEFRADDDGCLLLRVIAAEAARADVRREIDALVAEVTTRAGIAPAAVPPILLLFEPIASAVMPSLYRAADAYVDAHRGEGWGRSLLEAMAGGIPAIATRWGGSLAYMTDDNSWLVELAGLVEVPAERDVDMAGQRWAEPSVDSLREQMRKVFRDREAARAKAAQARADVVEKHSRKAVCAVALDWLTDLAGRIPEIRASRRIVRRSGAIEGRFEGEFSSVHGLSRVNRELGRALLATGRCDLALFDISPSAHFDLEGDGWRHVRANLGRTSGTPAFVIRHHWPPNFAAVHGKRLVLILPWELGRVPRAWVGYIGRTVDEVWVPSRFVRDAFLDSGADPARVFVVPNGVSGTRFHPGAPPRPLPTEKAFRFVFVGGAIPRKGFDILLSAYREAFTSSDDVALVIKRVGDGTHYQGQTIDDALDALHADPRAPEVVEVKGDLTDDEMASLYAAVHCMVHPYRGEGFALPVAEAMACAIPAIITRGGACDDWCDDSCAWMIPAQKVMARSSLETVGPAWSLEPDRTALASFMRAAASDIAAVRAMGVCARDVVLGKLTWERAADAAMTRLQALVAQ